MDSNAPALKEILQRELHDPWILGRIDLSECIAVEVHNRVIQGQAVRNVKCFRTTLDALAFTNLERSGERHVELQCARPANVCPAHVWQRAEIG